MPPLWLVRIRQRLQGVHAGGGHASRLRRRRQTFAKLYAKLPAVRLLMMITGYVWMFAIPYPELGRKTYIDENALQPSQVTTNWDWADVHRADHYLEQIEDLHARNASSSERAMFITEEFRRLGLNAHNQDYAFNTDFGSINGTNAYGLSASPRGSGSEAIVVSASWRSCIDNGAGQPNLRGIATVLSLAHFLRTYSLWAKDLIFVVGDGYLDGMHAWLSAYHHSNPSNLDVEELEISPGVIWTAVNIDYPGHSFSHLGIFFEGTNGRLPNQDLLNSFQVIAKFTGQVPVVLYDHVQSVDNDGHATSSDMVPTWVPQSFARDQTVRDYFARARHIVRHVGYQSRGTPSGVHGVFHRFRIDAFTAFAIPATGPHGFHAIGRIVESTLRTANNLLERLHASFFFYIMTGPSSFLKIGSYLPSAILVSVAMLFGGLRDYVTAGWTLLPELKQSEKLNGGSALIWVRRPRPVLPALTIAAYTHILGALLLTSLSNSWYLRRQTLMSPVLAVIFGVLGFLPTFIAQPSHRDKAPVSTMLKVISLCVGSTVISATSLLNFSLAAASGAVLGLPLSHAKSMIIKPLGFVAYSFYASLALSWIVLLPEEVRDAIWSWQLLGVWLAPFVCCIYVPLMLQAGLVCVI